MAQHNGHKNKRGIAIFAVLALIAVMAPVVYMFSRLGSQQLNAALKYHDSMLAEETAFSGHITGITRLRSTTEFFDFQNYVNQSSGSRKFDLTICPTGSGFLQQGLYMVLCKAKVGKHCCILASDDEQFVVTEPVLVIARHYFNTVEKYDITNAMDVLGIINSRGIELLKYEDMVEYEKHTKENAYITQANNLRASLPEELKNIWGSVVNVLANEAYHE